MSAAPPWPDPALMLALIAVLIVGVALRAGRIHVVHRDEWLDKVAGAAPDDGTPATYPHMHNVTPKEGL